MVLRFPQYSLLFSTLLTLGLSTLPAQADPAHSKGLLLYSVAESGARPAPPPYLRGLQQTGWDLEINPVQPDFESEHQQADHLRTLIDEARGKGYHQLTLIGEGFGAWVSLMANASFITPVEGLNLHAVIAVDASAAVLHRSATDSWHDYKFVNLLKAQDPARLALFLYDTPPDEGEDRRSEVLRSLSDPTRIAFVSVEDPAREGPHGQAFAARHLACLSALLNEEGKRLPASCKTDAPPVQPAQPAQNVK